MEKANEIYAVFPGSIEVEVTKKHAREMLDNEENRARTLDRDPDTVVGLKFELQYWSTGTTRQRTTLKISADPNY